MDAGFAGEFVEGKAAEVFDLQLVQDAREPRRSVAAFALRRARGKREDFGEKAFDGEILGRGRSFHFAQELHGKPKQRTAGDVVTRGVESGGGAIGEALLPCRAKPDFEKSDAAGANFVLVRNACGTEHEREGAVLTFATAAALAVVAVEHHTRVKKASSCECLAFRQQAHELQQLLRWAGKLAGRRVAHIAENGAGLLAGAVDGAEEVARAHVLGRKRGRGGNICVGCSVRHKVTSSRRLHLF